MSIHLSMNLLRTMLAATSDIELTPAADDAVKTVRKAGAPKELLEMYRIGIPGTAFVEMNGVRLFSIDGALAKNAERDIARTLGAAGYFVFAATAGGSVYALEPAASDDSARAVVRIDAPEDGTGGNRSVVSPSLDAFVFAFATNAISAG